MNTKDGQLVTKGYLPKLKPFTEIEMVNMIQGTFKDEDEEKTKGKM